MFPVLVRISCAFCKKKMALLENDGKSNNVSKDKTLSSIFRIQRDQKSMNSKSSL